MYNIPILNSRTRHCPALLKKLPHGRSQILFFLPRKFDTSGWRHQAFAFLAGEGCKIIQKKVAVQTGSQCPTFVCSTKNTVSLAMKDKRVIISSNAISDPPFTAGNRH